MKSVRCPICDSIVEIPTASDISESEEMAKPRQGLLPFCSVRCQQVDLQRWLQEEYHVPHVPDPDEADDGEDGGEHIGPSLN